MPNPTSNSVHINQPLTNISIAYLQKIEGFIADKFAPIVPVAKRSDKYYLYDQGDFYRDNMRKRAEGTESAGDGFRLSTDQYYADTFALHKDIADEQRANADSVLELDKATTEFLTHKKLINRETQFVNTMMISGVWDNDVTPATLWDDANGSPIVDIDTGKQTVLSNTGYEPNTLVLSYDTFIALRNNSEIIDRLKYGTQSNQTIARLSDMASLFDVERVLVGKAVKNNAKEGATNSFGFVSSKNALLAYVAPVAGKMQPSASYTFEWRGDNNVRPGIKKFRLEELNSDRIEIIDYFDQKVVGSNLGYFFENVIS